MDGTITAPYFDFATIKVEAGSAMSACDYLRYATGAGYERIHRFSIALKRKPGVADAKLNRALGRS